MRGKTTLVFFGSFRVLGETSKMIYVELLIYYLRTVPTN